MALSSPGIGSNLDVNGIVSQLMSVERQPIAALEKKEASFLAKLTAFGTLKGALSSFQSAVKGLSDVSKFQSLKVTTADATIATATARAGATPGTYSLEVTKLAQAQKLTTAGQASTSTSVGNGTLTFDFGTITGGSFDSSTGKYTGSTFTTNGAGTKTVTIDASNNTLSGIRDAINSAKIGVSATIVNDGGASPYRLVLTEESTGQTNSVKISVSGDAALSNLLAHDPGAAPAGQALSEKMTAQNAEFKVDGISISKSTNTVTDVIHGVTLNLLKETTSASKITVAADTAAVSTAVDQFVKAYNQINQTLKDLSAYNTTTKTASILTGDATVRSIQTQIRNTLNVAVPGGASSFSTLSQIGISTKKDGTLTVDSTKLQTAMESNFNEIAGLFAAVGKTSDSLVSFAGSTSKTASGAYAVNVSRVATQGKIVGDVATPASLTIDGTNNTLEVQLDGTTATVTLASATYASAAALAAEVQSKINGVSGFSSASSAVTVSESGGVLTLTSSRYGSGSKVSITGGNGKANLIGSGTITDGLDVAGTINGASGTGSGQFLTGATGDASEGLKLQITGTATGARGTVNFSRGYASQLSDLIDKQLGTNGLISSRTEGIDSSIKTITKSKERLATRLLEVEKRYRAQFVALDTAMANMTKTSAFLQQQLANLPKIE
jgi:flagellar hook-associated protein 2